MSRRLFLLRNPEGELVDSCNVVVVGAGMGGLVAANRALDKNLTVCLIEASERPGGSMKFSGGIVWTAKDRETIRRIAPDGDPDLQDALVDGVDELWSYLEEIGVEMKPEEDIIGVGRGRRFGGTITGQQEAVALHLYQRFLTGGGSFVGRTRVTDVTVGDDGRVTVEGTGQWDATYRITADAVIFASGGYHASKELVSEHVGDTSQIVLRGNVESRGTALELGQRLGAAITDRLDTFYGHSLAYPIHYETPINWIRVGQYYTDHCVITGWDGRRFVDEGSGVLEEVMPQNAARRSDPRYLGIFDERIYRERVLRLGVAPGTAGGGGDHDSFQLAADLGAWTARADTLEELLAKLAEWGVDAETLGKTLAEYNAVCRDGDPVQDLTPPRSRFADPVAEGPFRAIALIPGITFTTGGLRVTGDFRLKDAEGAALPARVYAVGADAGGVYAPFYAGGLAWAGVGAVRAVDAIHAELAAARV